MELKKIIFLYILAVLFWGAPLSSLAKSIDLSIDQTVFSFDAEPGKTYTFKLNVENGANAKKEIQMFAQDYDLEQNNTLKFLEERDSAHGISAWISASESSFDLDSKAKKEIVFTMKIPPEAEIGSHRGAVIAGTVVEQASGQSTEAVLSGRVGAHVLVNVKGETNGSGKIFSFKHPFFFWKKAVISADFENTGNVHYIPHGELLIKNLITKNEEKIVFDKHFVFPGKTFSFEKEWSDGSIFGIYSVRAAFVDGEGSVNLENGYSCGVLFFPLAATLFFGLYLIWKKIKQRQRLQNQE